MIKFAIITPTYRRPSELLRATESVFNNDDGEYDFVHIIVNDSPEYNYDEFLISEIYNANKNKIKYYINTENKGVNYSRNFAIQEILNKPEFSPITHIIFLDDDDALSRTALHDIAITLNELKTRWLVTNRVIVRDKATHKTKCKKHNKPLSYIFNYMLLREVKGDATHTIHISLLKGSNNAKFSKSVKQGEEWLFFTQLNSYFIYNDLDTTISWGYSEGGLTDSLRRKLLHNTIPLFLESVKLLYKHPGKLFLTLIYLKLRTIKQILKIIIH